ERWLQQKTEPAYADVDHVRGLVDDTLYDGHVHAVVRGRMYAHMSPAILESAHRVTIPRLIGCLKLPGLPETPAVATPSVLERPGARLLASLHCYASSSAPLRPRAPAPRSGRSAGSPRTRWPSPS